MATRANHGEARRAIRRRTDAPSTLRGGATGPIDTFVHDVSRTGARIECTADLAIGDFVSIGLAGVGAIRAIVVWKREHQYGLDFVVPLDGEDAARAFAGGTVVSLTPPARTEAPMPIDEQEDGVYAEATGWLSVLGFIMIAGTALGVALLRGWVF